MHTNIKTFVFLLLCCAGWAKTNAAYQQKDTIRVIVIGAHPDDCDLRAGGMAALYVSLGHKVKFVSLTNGDKGHQTMGGGPLAVRRLKEAKEAGRRLGIEYEIMDNHDGELIPSLENRMKVIKVIRDWNADIVISCRPFDYHPDHRNAGLLVQDAAYLVIVPNILSGTPALKKNPLFLYARDGFIRPNPFRPDITIDISSVYSKKIDEMDAHVSQYYEWLPWTENQLDQIPTDPLERKKWLAENYTENVTPEKQASIEKWYGPGASKRITNIESFEICEYGFHPSDSDIRRLFPMLPSPNAAQQSAIKSKKTISLFDGHSLRGWHGFNKQGKVNNWVIKDGSLVCLGAVKGVDYGGDLATDRAFGNFELTWDWKVDSGSNSGVMYHVAEGPKYKAPYETGPEFQLMDDASYSNGLADPDQQSCANYGMYPASDQKTLHPVGQWNTSKLVYNNGHVEHWVNGSRVLEFEEGSPDWNDRKEKGKWKSFPSYAKFKQGKICLQDHGHKAYYKNMLITLL